MVKNIRQHCPSQTVLVYFKTTIFGHMGSARAYQAVAMDPIFFFLHLNVLVTTMRKVHIPLSHLVNILYELRTCDF